MRYRRKEDIVKAFRFDRDAEVNAPGWFGEAVQEGRIFINRCLRDGAAQVYGCTIQTEFGRVQAKVGDYIVMNADLEIVPCKEGRFEKQYERIWDG